MTGRVTKAPARLYCLPSRCVPIPQHYDVLDGVLDERSHSVGTDERGRGESSGSRQGRGAVDRAGRAASGGIASAPRVAALPHWVLRAVSCLMFVGSTKSALGSFCRDPLSPLSFRYLILSLPLFPVRSAPSCSRSAPCFTCHCLALLFFPLFPCSPVAAPSYCSPAIVLPHCSLVLLFFRRRRALPRLHGHSYINHGHS